MKKPTIFILALFLANATMAQWFWQNPLPQANDLTSVMFPNSSIGYAVGNLGTIILLMQRELKEPSTTIDVNTLPCGIYLVKLVSVKNVQVGKFIKQ